MTDTAITAAGQTAIATAESNDFHPVQGYICTFDMNSDEGRVKAIAAYNDAESLAQHVGEVIKLVDVLTMPGVRKSRIPNVPDTDCQNTYLIDAAGVAYFSQSDGVARSINMLVSAFPTLDYKGQGFIEVACIEKQLPNGNTVKNIKPVLN